MKPLNKTRSFRAIGLGALFVSSLVFVTAFTLPMQLTAQSRSGRN